MFRCEKNFLHSELEWGANIIQRENVKICVQSLTVCTCMIYTLLADCTVHIFMLLMRFAFVAMKNTHNFIRKCNFSFHINCTNGIHVRKIESCVVCICVFRSIWIFSFENIKAKHKINRDHNDKYNHTTAFYCIQCAVKVGIEFIWTYTQHNMPLIKGFKVVFLVIVLF